MPHHDALILKLHAANSGSPRGCEAALEIVLIREVLGTREEPHCSVVAQREAIAHARVDFMDSCELEDLCDDAPVYRCKVAA